MSEYSGDPEPVEGPDSHELWISPEDCGKARGLSNITKRPLFGEECF